MIKEIGTEITYVLAIVTVIMWGLLFCDIYDREMFYEERYQSWEYNLNPQEGTGFYDAMVDKTK